MNDLKYMNLSILTNLRAIEIHETVQDVSVNWKRSRGNMG